jgi:hypothetical protein
MPPTFAHLEGQKCLHAPASLAMLSSIFRVDVSKRLLLVMASLSCQEFISNQEQPVEQGRGINLVLPMSTIMQNQNKKLYEQSSFSDNNNPKHIMLNVCFHNNNFVFTTPEQALLPLRISRVAGPTRMFAEKSLSLG